MKRDNVNYFVLGCFVVSMIVAFFALMYYVTGRTGPTDRYFVYYDNVRGLKYGTGVYYEGYRIGQVDKIEPQPGAKGMHYKLALAIARGWRVPEDSVARIVASGLISAVDIQIDEGASTSAIAPGGEIAGAAQIDLFAALNRAVSHLGVLSETGIVPVLENLNNRITEVADEILKFRQDELTPFMKMLHVRIDDELFNDLERVLSKMDDSATSLQQILGGENRDHIESFMIHIDDVAVSLKDLVGRVDSTRAQMDRVLGAVGALVTDHGAEMSNTIGGAEASVEEMRRSLTTLNEHLDDILYHVEGSARQMHEFTRAIRDNPARLLRGSGTNDEVPSQ